MEPHRASDEAEPENPRMGEKEACYESLKRAAEKLMKGQVTSFADMRLLEAKLAKAGSVIRDQTDSIVGYSERNAKLTTMLEQQKKLLTSLEFDVKATQTMCNCIKESLTAFGERVLAASSDVEASVKYVKRQDETVLALEAEVKLIHQWKDEQLKKFRQLKASEAERKQEIRNLEMLLEQSRDSLTKVEQEKGRLQGQLSVGAETIATLTSKVAKYRDRSKLIQEELSRATKNQAALSAALAESNQKYNQLVDVSKQEACIAESTQQSLAEKQAVLLEDLSALRRQIDTLVGQRTERDAEIEKLNQGLISADLKHKAQEERIGSLTGENEALQESKASLANELADLREQLTIASENCAALATESDKREQLLQELRTELKELKMHLAGQQAEHKAVEEAIVKQHQIAIEAKEVEIARQQQEAEHFIQEIELLRTELKEHEEVRARVETLEVDLTCSARSLAALEKELALQQDLRTRGEKELEARCEENHHLRDLLADMDRKNGALQEALRLEEAKLDEIGGRLSMEQNRANETFAHLSAERDLKEGELKRQITKLQESVQEKDKALKDLERTKSHLREELSRQAAIAEEDRVRFSGQIARLEEAKTALEQQTLQQQKQLEVCPIIKDTACADPSNQHESEDGEDEDENDGLPKKRKRTVKKLKGVHPGQKATRAKAAATKKRVVRKRRLPTPANTCRGKKKATDLFDDVFAFHSENSD